jgi:hypothetical protein
MRKALFCAIALMFLPISAPAQSPAAVRVMQNFGLMGTWAGECKDEPSPVNNHATYAATPDGLRLKNSFGEGYEDSIYEIVDARAQGSDKLSIRLVLTTDDQIVIDVVLMKEKDRIRIWSSTTGEGKSLVKEGVIAAPVNRETRWSSHCG